MSRARRNSPIAIAARAPSMALGCDGTALTLLVNDSAAVETTESHAMMRRRDKPEDIDTEEDDDEFEERAHWGRRRGKATAAKSKNKNAKAEDKTQPKINLFCVVKQKEPPLVDGVAIAEDAVGVVVEENEDGNGGRSVEVYVQSAAEEIKAPAQPLSVVAQETMQSGRPKRQAVLRAEQALLHQDDDAFMTPPAMPTAKKTPVNRATLDGEPERKVATSGPSGRKRKLEMAGEKKKSTPAQSATTTADSKPRPPSSVFFLTEQQKQQVIEIEAVASFKEQLKQQRERDQAFYGNREAKNPFFKGRSGSSSQKAIDVDAPSKPHVINLLDTPEPSPAKGSKSRWCKGMTMFPELHHSLAPTLTEVAPTLLRLPPKKALQPFEEILDVDTDDEDMESGNAATDKAVGSDGVAVEKPFDDSFWLLFATSPPDELAPLASLANEELVEKVSEAYGIKEKRVRKTLAALQAARTKRQDKTHNLSLVDRYLPVQTNGMVGNKTALKKLCAWLSAWKSGGDNRDRRYDSELFAFEGDDSEEDEEDTQLFKLFVLRGDVGSGKSAAVSACAEELGYEIIEINAGQLRSGKAIVDIAGEATQSTRVLHTGGLPGDNKTSKGKKKKSKKRRKEDEAAKPSHLSLVLFEDVDLVFEDDKGFFSTLGSIAKHSKCPIVVTCRHVPDGFPCSPPAISECLKRPSAREFIAWLSLVAYLEEIPLAHGLASRLAHLYGCDVRRALQFLQTYRLRLELPTPLQRRQSLAWTPAIPPTRGAVGSGVDMPIDIAESEGEALDEFGSSHLIPAWARSTIRGFDLLTANFLPSLRGSLCDMCPTTEEEADPRPREQKERDVQRLSDVYNVLDTISVGDEWETTLATRHSEKDEVDTGADYFHMEAVRMRSLALRKLSLQTFSKEDGDVLHLTECTLGDGIDRAMLASRQADDRSQRATRLATLKTKLDLPFLVKGSARVGTRFSSDYIPMVARILESSEPQQESRRRASRRHHYLRDVLSDMSVVDEIQEFHAYVLPVQPLRDEIVPSSMSPPPLEAVGAVMNI